MRYNLKEDIIRCVYQVMRSFVPDLLNAIITTIQVLRKR